MDHGKGLTTSISLRAVRRPIGVDFKDLHELGWEYDFTPPSLYVFKKGKEYNDMLNSGEEIFLEDLPDGIKCTYLEGIQPEDIDYRRCIVLTLK